MKFHQMFGPLVRYAYQWLRHLLISLQSPQAFQKFSYHERASITTTTELRCVWPWDGKVPSSIPCLCHACSGPFVEPLALLCPERTLSGNSACWSHRLFTILVHSRPSQCTVLSRRVAGDTTGRHN